MPTVFINPTYILPIKNAIFRNNNLKDISFVLILLFIKTFAIGQIPTTHLRQISQEQGLPGENITDITQDKNGYLWFCVEASGICKFDGTSFINLKKRPKGELGISSNNANMVRQDKNGLLWIATDYGLNKFDQEKNEIKSYYHSPNDSTSICNNTIYSIAITRDNSIYIGTGNGLCKYDKTNDSFIRIPIDVELQYNISALIYTIYEYSDGTIWLGTSLGLIHYNQKTNHFKLYQKGLSNNAVRRIIEDKNGNLWIGTYFSLNFFDKTTEEIKQWTFKNPLNKTAQSDGFSSFYFDKNGTLWAGSYSSGVVLISADYTYDYPFLNDPLTPANIKSKHIRDIFFDNNNGIWIGTKFAGLYYSDTRKNIFKSKPEKLALFDDVYNVYALSFCNDGDSVYWIGTRFDGLYKIDIHNQTTSNFFPTISNSDTVEFERIQHLIRDKNKNLWIGSTEGLIKRDIYNKNYLVSNKYLNYLLEDSKGIIWVGTLNGIYIVDQNKTKLINYQNPHVFFNDKSLDILNIFEDSHNNIWFSTRSNGLYKLDRDNENIHFYNNSNASYLLNSNMMRFTTEDKDGNIWVGTRDCGIFKYDPNTERFINIDEMDGLSTNFLLSAQVADNGDIWIGTHNGLSHFNPKTKQSINFFTEDGFQNNIYEINASGQLTNGYLFFGGDKGFNIFHPDSIDKPEITSPVIFTSVKSSENVLLRNINSNQSIELKHNENNITFDFVVLDFNSSTNVTYQCYFEGIDKNWFALNKGNTITYKSLPNGNFTFKIRASNSYGNWSTGPEINIRVLPPIYSTWSFRLALIIFLAIIIYIIYRYKIHAINQRNNLLEKVIRERTQKLEQANHELSITNEMIHEQKLVIETHNEQLETLVDVRTHDLTIAKKKAEESDRLKSAFLANMSHEIRTPLNAIVGFSSLLADENITFEEKTNYVTYVNANTSNLLKIIDDILDISKIEAGQMVFEKRWISIVDFLQQSFINLSTHHQNTNFEFDFNLSLDKNISENKKIYTDPFRLEQIISNLVLNAFKYTSKGEVKLGILDHTDYIEIYISDTGIGIPKEFHHTIFGRFLKVEGRSKFFKGTGLGLAICKSIVELLEGKIWFESEPDKGSTFHFTIPLIKDDELLKN